MSLDLHPQNASVWQAATTCLQTQWHSNMADQSIPVASRNAGRWRVSPRFIISVIVTMSYIESDTFPNNIVR